MKRILKVVLISLLIVIAGGLVGSYVYYHSYSPELKNVSISENNLSYFQDSYQQARDLFIQGVSSVRGNYDTIEIHEFQIPSKVDSTLYMDICYIPPTVDTVRLLVIISGTHGIEGYTGSAIQQMFLKEYLNKSLSGDMGILLIHAFNPYGFKYFRKATENNVDLNRNCSKDHSVFNIKNPGYSKLYDLLCPSGVVNTYTLHNQFFYLVAIWKIVKESMATLRQAALQGQYEYEEGIYYGGKDFTPQTRILQSILPDIFKPYRLVFAIDLHTGYGELGKLHLFPNPEKDENVKSLTESLFDGYPIDWGDTDDFYTIDGDVSEYIKQVNPDATTLCMPFEFGTLNSQETMGALQSIHRMILENQGFFYGYKNDKVESNVKKSYREMYYPSSEAWRSEVIRQTRDMLNICLEKFVEMKVEHVVVDEE